MAFSSVVEGCTFYGVYRVPLALLHAAVHLLVIFVNTIIQNRFVENHIARVHFDGFGFALC